MKIKKKIVLLVVVFIFGFLIYRAPDESHWLNENPDDAISIGRTYAYYLLNGNKTSLLKMSIEPAKNKIEHTEFHQIAIGDILEDVDKKKIPRGLVAPLLVEQQDENMELVALEYFKSFIVLTFAYKGMDNTIVEIPEKEKMLFSIALRYYEASDDHLPSKLIRKTANLPLLRNFTGRLGTTGRWVVFNYHYRYNINDYYAWLLKEGNAYQQKQLKELRESTEQLKEMIMSGKLHESMESELVFLYEWGGMATEKQIERIERLYQLSEEPFKNIN